MWYYSLASKLIILILYLSRLILEASARCSPFLTAFPAPKNLTAPIITDAVSQLKDQLTSIINNETLYTEYDLGNTSFSIDFYSVYGEGDSLFTHHHSAPVLAEHDSPVINVTSNSIYRIGSISKLWTVYLWLLANGGDGAFNDPITNYIQELADYAEDYGSDPTSLDYVDWAQITVGAVARQLTGMARDVGPWRQLDTALQQAIPGLPNVRYPNVTFCGDLSTDTSYRYPCTRGDFFADVLYEDPVAEAFRSPVYSNNGFQILGYALANITNTSVPDLFQSYLIDAIGLNASSYTVPSSNQSGVIPLSETDSGWNVDIIDASTAGGYFTSINDARKVGISILNSTFLTKSQTLNWFKPATFTSSLGFAVGAPWEIQHFPSTSSQVSESKNATHWIYTKEGDIGLYTSLVGFIPELGLGFTVFAVGPTTAHLVAIGAADIATETMIPALDEAARVEANTIYDGTYTDESNNSTITLTTNSEQLGVIVTEFTYNGTDLLALLTSFIIPSDSTSVLSVHLYPTGLMSQNETETVIGWRAVFAADPPMETYPGLFSSQCWTWASLDGLGYAGYAFDDIRTILNADGTKATGVNPRALRITMTR